MITRPITRPLTRAITSAIAGITSDSGELLIPTFDYLVTVGSSTTFETFGSNTVLGRQENAARLAFSTIGRDIPIINKAVGGSTIANLDTNINTYLTELGPISSADPSRVAVIINIGSNDIGVTSYGAMAQATKDAMLVGLNSIVDKIIAFGFTPVLATVHSRKTYEAMYEEWADLMYRPLVDARTPFWKSGSLAVFDYCRLYLENKDVVNWWQADNVHPWMATAPMQSYTAQNLSGKSILPAANAVERAMFFFPQAAKYAGGLNGIIAAASGNLESVYKTDGALISGASFSWAGAVGASGSVRTNPGAWNVALDHNFIQGCTLYGTATITFTAAFGAAFANRTGVLRVTGSSSATGRLTNIVAGASSAVLNASGPGVQIVELPFTMDAAGSLVFTAAPQSPSTFANASGVELVFN